MSTTFKRVTATANTTRTLVYTVPASTTAIIFSGMIFNVDSTNKADHSVTVEIQKTDSSYEPMYPADLMVAYGGAPKLPKRVLSAGEKIYVTADAANSIVLSLDLVERS